MGFEHSAQETTTRHPHRRRSDRIDIHHSSRKLQRDLRSLDNDDRLTDPQKSAIRRFVHDARVGRTVARRARKQISDGRCQKYLYHLRRFAIEMDRTPLDQITPEQMELFILGIESGDIGKLKGDGPYAHETVLDYKKILRKFYGYLHGHASAKALDLVGWFDMREDPPELTTFDLKQAEGMAYAAASVQGRALIMNCFDGGPRPGELFNVRLRDLTFIPDAQGELVAHTRVRFSKTKPRLISLPLATDALRCWVRRHPSGGEIRADGTIDALNPDAPLFTWSYHYCRKVLRRLGKEELSERLYFYRFRHSSATFYARHLTEYQMCARYGWVMGSDAVRRYVDASGVLALDTASTIRKAVADEKQRAMPSSRSVVPVSTTLLDSSRCG